jgi:hypothetical protein
MSRTFRSLCGAITLLFLSSWPFAQAIAQTQSYKYGFCTGVAGSPPDNYITRAFALGPASADLRAEFMRGLGEKYGGNVRRDATGCRMSPSASEAEQARSRLLDQARSMPKPFVAIDWIPKGATALSAPPPAPGSKANGSDTAGPHNPR